MIDTKNFVHSINSNNIPRLITKYFDEILVLYNLVGYRMNIELNDDSSDVARFILTFDTEENANALYSSLHDTDFTIYDDKFHIIMDKSDLCSIHTTIVRVC